MKLSEHIALCQLLLQRHGDVDVTIVTTPDCDTTEQVLLEGDVEFLEEGEQGEWSDDFWSPEEKEHVKRPRIKIG